MADGGGGIRIIVYVEMGLALPFTGGEVIYVRRWLSLPLCLH